MTSPLEGLTDTLNPTHSLSYESTSRPNVNGNIIAQVEQARDLRGIPDTSLISLVQGITKACQ